MTYNELKFYENNFDLRNMSISQFSKFVKNLKSKNIIETVNEKIGSYISDFISKRQKVKNWSKIADEVITYRDGGFVIIDKRREI